MCLSARGDKKDLKYKIEYDACIKRKITFEENEHKAFADLWEHYAKALKDKIETRSDFQSMTHKKPINLLRSMKEHSLSYEEVYYEMATIVDACEDYFQCMQLNGESLLDYTRRFKVVREALPSYPGGPIELKKHVQDQSEHLEGRTAVMNSLTIAADEKLATCLCLAYSDQGKCGSVLKHLNSQTSLTNDQFPKTIIDGNSLLRHYEFDERHNEKSKIKNRTKKKVDNEDKSQEEDLTLSFAELECTCYWYGKKGHTSSTCHLKEKLPKDQWAINKSKSQFLQQEADKRKKEDSLGKCIKWAY